MGFSIEQKLSAISRQLSAISPRWLKVEGWLISSMTLNGNFPHESGRSLRSAPLAELMAES
jgi:hypothetical protein